MSIPVSVPQEVGTSKVSSMTLGKNRNQKVFVELNGLSKGVGHCDGQCEGNWRGSVDGRL